MESENLIIDRAKKGDRAAGGELYSIYFDQIYRYLFVKINDRQEAEDLTQSVFISALKNINSYKERDGASFSSWLYRIAHNKYVDALRKKNKTYHPPIDEAYDLSSNELSAQENIEKKEQIAYMLKAVKDLTDAQQEVVALRFGRELSIAQTAQIMGKSEGAVKALQHAAVKSLQKKFT